MDNIRSKTANGETTVKSLSGFFEKIEDTTKLQTKAGFVFFYRGHGDKDYKLEPSIYRKKMHKRFEHRMFKELLMENPKEFADEKSTIDKLIKMQHHGLPTRLLDLTRNPLVALYFACEKTKDKKNGEVIVFSIQGNVAKYDDDISVLILSNLCKLADIEGKKSSNKEGLLQEILLEKPELKTSPKNEITTEDIDLNKIIPINAKKNNERIKAQDGLFLLYGINDKNDSGSPTVKKEWIVSKIIIDAKSKDDIKKQLEKVGISERTLFPGLDNNTKFMSERFAYGRSTSNKFKSPEDESNDESDD